MKKISHFLLYAALLLACTTAFAKPAPRTPFAYTQPDGTTVTLKLHGDEFYHWYTCGDQIVKIDVDGYVRPVVSAPRSATSSAAKRKASTMDRRVRKDRPAKSGSFASDNHYLVLLISFDDLPFTTPDASNAFSAMLNSEGYSADGAIGSARDYFYDNSMGKFEPVFDVYGPVKVSKGYAYYGQNDEDGNDLRPATALVEACAALDSQIDFSRYDTDGDGYVDNVFFYFAGHTEAEYASENTIWSHSWDVESAINFGEDIDNYTFDGVKMGVYACDSELTGASGSTMIAVGSFCHEFCHTLGLPDFYDTDYDDHGEADDMLWYSLMSSGNYNDGGRKPPYLTAIERNMLGWMDEPEIWTSNGKKTIAGIQDNVAYMLPTDKDDEFFVLECRTDQKWDAGLEDTGLLIYHVDQSSNSFSSTSARMVWYSNEINAYSAHPCCYVVASNPDADYYADDYLFPGYVNATSFTGKTNPASKSWSGRDIGCHLYDIAYSNNAVTLTYREENELSSAGVNYIDNPGKGFYKSGSTFALKLVESSNPPSSVSWTFDGNAVSGTSVALTAGEHTVKAVLTYGDGTTETLEQIIIAQ